MTEEERLQQLVEQGYRTNLRIRKPSSSEIRRNLPTYYWNKQVFALPLWHADKQNLMFYFVNSSTYSYAQSLIEAGSEVLSYDLWVYCSAIGKDADLGKVVHFDKVIESLRSHEGLKVYVSEYPNTFEINLNIAKSGQYSVEECVTYVDQLLMFLSFKNRIGIEIDHYSPSPIYADQPVSIKSGLPERMLNGLDRQDAQALDKVREDGECMDALQTIRRFYAQTDSHSMLLIGWAAIERLFQQDDPEHILSEGQRSEIKKAIKGLSWMDGSSDRYSKLAQAIEESHFLHKEGRNKRIARSISDICGWDLESTYRQIQNISRIRGKSAHELSQQDPNPEIELIDKALREYVTSKLPNKQQD